MPTDHDPYLTYLRRSLYGKLPFLAAAIHTLIPREENGLTAPFATDGTCLFFDGPALKALTEENETMAALLYLREVIFCLLGYPFRITLPGEEIQKEEVSRYFRVLLPEKEAQLKQLPAPDKNRWQSAKKPAAGLFAGGNGGGNRRGLSREALEAKMREWESLRARMGVDPNRKRPGLGSSLSTTLTRPRLTEERRAAYRDFLRTFSSLRENARENPEEFSYADYYLGQELLGFPLFEPLESTLERKIAELVIVIDTSGSCQGEPVRIFLEETRNILLKEQLFFSRFHLEILQCDNRIRHKAVIRDSREFESYIETLTLIGGGGTDYRPAFDYVTEQVKSGAFSHLAGLLCFSDGVGRYPAKEAPFPTAFVLPEGISDTMDMPDWILRLFIPRRGTKENE